MTATSRKQRETSALVLPTAASAAKITCVACTQHMVPKFSAFSAVSQAILRSRDCTGCTSSSEPGEAAHLLYAEYEWHG